MGADTADCVETRARRPGSIRSRQNPAYFSSPPVKWMELTPQLDCLKPGKVNGTAGTRADKCPWGALGGNPAANAAPKEGWAQQEPTGCPHSPLSGPLCWYQPSTGSCLGLGPSANPPLPPGFISIPACWGCFQSWRIKLGGSQPDWWKNPHSFVLLAKAMAYNNVWPWKLNYFQPRSLWKRWWLHSSPVSHVEKPSPKKS